MLGLTVSDAVALVLLKLVAPPTLAGRPMSWPAAPWVPSQASHRSVAVPDWFTVGLKRSRALPGSSNADASDNDVGTFDVR